MVVSFLPASVPTLAMWGGGYLSGKCFPLTMLGLQVKLGYAQLVKEYLIHHELLDPQAVPKRGEDSIIFPVAREFSLPWEFEADFVETTFEGRGKPSGLREQLREHLSEGELDDLITAFDIVGSIAIIEIPDSLSPKELMIAERLMAVNTSVKTVLKKIGGHQGRYRIQELALVAGEDTRETEVQENGVKLKVNVAEAYYSIRMATERKRILSLIAPGEQILCLFSGVGPYPIIFSKHSGAREIVGVELNPVAHALAVENVAMNRCTNVHLIEGDAHAVLKKLSGRTFDRVTMPLPHSADEFLDDVIPVLKSGGVLHFYSFQHEDEFEKAVRTVRVALQRNGRRLGDYSVVKAGQHAPRIWRVCVDATVT